MGRSRSFHVPQDLKPYDVQSSASSLVHTSVTNKKWWLGFCCAVLGILLLLYLPCYHQLQTRIGEALADDLVGTHCLNASVYT